MADWSLIESTLKAWIEDISGLPARWKDRPVDQDYVETGYVELYIPTETTVAGDFIFTEYDPTQPNGSEIRTYARGARTFPLYCKIVTWSAEVGDDAKYYARLIRKRLGLPVRTGAALAAAEIAVGEVLADVPVVQAQDGRSMSIRQLDILINGVDEAEDDKGQWIEVVKDAEAQFPEGTTVWTGDMDLP